jgi:hypothetical protein
MKGVFLGWFFGLVVPVQEIFYPALAALVSPVPHNNFPHRALFQFLWPRLPAIKAGSRAGPPVSECVSPVALIICTCGLHRRPYSVYFSQCKHLFYASKSSVVHDRKGCSRLRNKLRFTWGSVHGSLYSNIELGGLTWALLSVPIMFFCVCIEGRGLRSASGDRTSC